MKKLSAGRSVVYILIFLAILLASLLCIRPVYHSAAEAVTGRINTFRTYVEKKTGLTFSYVSLSPSILTGFRVKGIVLSSAGDGKKIVTIRKVVLRYNIIRLLRKDTDHAFRDLTIDGVIIDYSDPADREIVRRIIRLFSKEGASSDAPLPSSGELSVHLPFAVSLKNVTLNYTSGAVRVSASVKKASAGYEEKSGALAVSASGGADCVLVSYKGIHASGRYSLSGLVSEGLEGSSVLVRFSDFKAGDYALDRLNFLVSYSGRTVKLRSVQNAVPIMLQGSYGIDSGAAELSFAADHFTPSSFITSQKHADVIRKLQPVQVTLTAHAGYSFHDSRLSYESSGGIYLPEELVNGTLTAKYRLSGDEKQLHIHALSLTGRNCDATFSLGCIFDGLRLSGEADLRRVVLPNGGIISADLLFDPRSRGFVCFSPEVTLGDRSFTAMQLSVSPRKDSVDCSFEISDYSHADSDKPGKITIDGSYLTGSKYVQAGVSVSDFYLDSGAAAAAFFMPEENRTALDSAVSLLQPYMFTGEFYLSSDLKTLSYNVPYALVANTKKDNQFLLMSVDGNESSLQVTQFDLVSGRNTLHASAEIDRAPDESGAFFTADASAGQIPYHFTGTVMKNWLSMSGDYGTSLQVRLTDDGGFDGSLALASFPVPVSGALFTVSTETGFAYTVQDGFAMQIARFEAEDAGGKFSFHPKLTASGKISKYGAFFDMISYSDIYSSLNGSSNIFVNMNEGKFDSANLDFSVKNPLSDESIKASAEVTNPDGLALTGDSLKNSIYFNAQLSFKDFSLNRFSSEQSDNNSLTASVTASGTFEKPYVALTVDSADMMLAGVMVSASGSAALEEKEISVNSMNIRYGAVSLDSVTADFSADTMTGTASARVVSGSGDGAFEMPLRFVLSDTVMKKNSLIPASFAAELSSPGEQGSFIAKSVPFTISVLRSEGETTVFSSDNIGLSGHISDSGAVDISVADDKPVHFRIAGRNDNQKLDIRISDIYADGGVIASYFTIPGFTLYGGTAKGSVKIGGLLSDPEFTGAVAIDKPDYSLPLILPSHITAPKMIITMAHNEISVPEMVFNVKNVPVKAKARIYFDRWALDRIEGTVRTFNGQYAPADLDVGVAEFAGDTGVDLDIVFQSNILDVTGKVYVQDVKGKIRAEEVAGYFSESGAPMPFEARADLDIVIGPHVSIVFDPVLRCVFVPDSSFNFKIDQAERTFAIKGDVMLKSGDIAYLNRSFYLKSGMLRFNDNEQRFNPIVSVRAETRERDDDGNEIRIILTAENQPLLSFNPQFSSIPARSEVEIRTILGQLAVGDSSSMSGILVAAGDYAVQSTVGRVVENKLRDLLNFDIFSVRTNVLQNTLNMGIAGTFTSGNLTPGNFLDNSTVYIGKYFGSVMYADALMHWSYDKTRVDDKTTANGLVFKPEFGLEFESPFADIRWDVAPNIDAMMNNIIVPSTSLTLSWKFSF